MFKLPKYHLIWNFEESCSVTKQALNQKQLSYDHKHGHVTSIKQHLSSNSCKTKNFKICKMTEMPLMLQNSIKHLYKYKINPKYLETSNIWYIIFLHEHFNYSKCHKNIRHTQNIYMGRNLHLNVYIFYLNYLIYKISTKHNLETWKIRNESSHITLPPKSPPPSSIFTLFVIFSI